MERFPFETKTPTKVPFEEMKIWDSKIEVDKQQAVITLMNVNKSTFDIHITKNNIEYAKDLKKENVRIDKNLIGDFIPNDWIKDSYLERG